MNHEPHPGRTLPVVLVGCGSMARTWVRAAVEDPAIRLTGLVDLDTAHAHRLAAEFDLPTDLVYADLGEAIDATRAEAVFDVTIPEAHRGVTLHALARGCHVLGEKPLSVDMASAREMVAAAEAADRVYAVTQSRRAHPAFHAIRRYLADDGLGRVAEVHADFFRGPRFGGFRDQMAHPLLVDMAIHAFDNARQLTGADPLRVFAQAWNPAHSWYAGQASALAIFEMTDGLTFTFRGSWCADGHPTAWDADWRIVGGRGTLRWDGESQIHLQHRRDDPADPAAFEPALVSEVLSPEPLPHQGHTLLIREFARHVLSERRTPLECPASDNLRSLAMVHAAVQSADSGQPVCIDF